MKLDVVIRKGCKLFLPFIILFALYVQLHGDYGPGGGFQAGVILASAVILHTLVFGLFAAKRAIPPIVMHVMMPTGVLIYAGTGLAGLLLGGNYLEYEFLAADPVHAQEWGVFWAELGVMITVAGTMGSLFHAFVGRGRKH